MVASGIGAQAAVTPLPQTREDVRQTKFNQIVKSDVRNRDELLKQGRRVDELWEFGIRRPEVEKNWLLETLLECNQKYVSWPDFSDRLALSNQLTVTRANPASAYDLQ